VPDGTQYGSILVFAGRARDWVLVSCGTLAIIDGSKIPRESFMFERIFAFLKNLPGGHGASSRTLTEDDPRVAAAALLVHVIRADGERNDDELRGLTAALSKAYNLHGAELKAVIEAAQEAEASAVDIYTFTTVLKRHLDEEARIEFIRLVWEIVLSDGVMRELEENLVWRIAELIGVDGRTRVTIRQQVLEERGGIPGST